MRSYWIKVFAILNLTFTLQVAATKNLQEDELPPDEEESYDSRPDIISVRATQHKINLTNADWQKLKYAHVETVAMLLALYPDREIYFLARDAELFYDTAKLILKNDTLRQKKIHLLNVSRANMLDPNLVEYLKQEGISTTAFAGGTKVLFVDTGFKGTIPEYISRKFSQYKSQIEVQLMCSTDSMYPSTRSFLIAFRPEAFYGHPGDMRQSVLSAYEYITHFTGSSTKFELGKDKKWHAMSATESSYINNSGKVDKIEAQKLMEDLRFFVESQEGKDLYQNISNIWKKIYQLGKSENKAGLINYLTQILRDKSKDGMLIEAIVKDFINALQINDIFGGRKFSFSPSDVGLEETTQFYDPGNLKIIKNLHPNLLPIPTSNQELSNFINNPENEETIKQLLNLVVDDFFWKNFFSILGNMASDQSRKVIAMAIDQNSKYILPLIAKNIFVQPNIKIDILNAIISKAIQIQSMATLRIIAEGVFYPNITEEMVPSLVNLINAAFELNDHVTPIYLASKVFSMREQDANLNAPLIKLIEVAVKMKKRTILQSLSSPKSSLLLQLKTKGLQAFEPVVILVKGLASLGDRSTLATVIQSIADLRLNSN
ncbi:MAG: hypothetical protein QE271_03505 [Bacteriovoracaceae bacterium]|nr:hypothetical protein [Bacteriovoracaceae bacterium]